jgi:hypothetical protein
MIGAQSVSNRRHFKLAEDKLMEILTSVNNAL